MLRNVRYSIKALSGGTLTVHAKFKTYQCKIVKYTPKNILQLKSMWFKYFLYVVLERKKIAQVEK